jgi:hypothetical protein
MPKDSQKTKEMKCTGETDTVNRYSLE